MATIQQARRAVVGLLVALRIWGNIRFILRFLGLLYLERGRKTWNLGSKNSFPYGGLFYWGQFG